MDERRRAERHAVDAPGRLFLSEGRVVPVHIRDLGELGALVQLADLEEAVLEGERTVLEHPRPGAAGVTRRAGSVVRVELEFREMGILRQLAVFFDAGPPPEGYAG